MGNSVKKGMGSHQSQRMIKDEWLTPPHIFKALGRFDLDPCHPILPPWHIAEKSFTIEDNGLIQVWDKSQRIWCNPPYGTQSATWLHKLAEHGNAIVLIFAHTETKMFFDHVWNKADSLLFIEGRLYFHYVNGERAMANSGAPSVLIAYGKNNSDILKGCNIPGKFIQLKQ